MTEMTFRKSGPLNGLARVPGDKSMSHRALMFGALAIGETIISGLLEGEDVLNTAAAMRAMGADIQKGDDGLWRCFGVGVGGLKEPSAPLDMGNGGTPTRLLIGLVGTHPITVTFTGDASLSSRPMGRVITPLEQMGATFQSREGGRLPLTVSGSKDPLSIEYTPPMASAQVKSAVMLAALNTRGTTTVIEKVPTRDHTENMLRHFGVKVEIEDLPDGTQAIHVEGHQELQGCAVDIYADPSSAAFPAVAAAINDGSDVRIPNVGLNVRRAGVFETLKDMGADITFDNERMQGGEPVADIVVRGSQLKGIEVPAERVPSMIDEFPILAMAAACAQGTTTMTNLGELRVKESDRLAMVAKGLRDCGVELEEGEESLTIFGQRQAPRGGARIETALDHRIAMSFAVLGSVSEEPIEIDDAAPIKTSFPEFNNVMRGLGMVMSNV